jgi:hypothetical protein
MEIALSAIGVPAVELLSAHMLREKERSVEDLIAQKGIHLLSITPISHNTAGVGNRAAIDVLTCPIGLPPAAIIASLMPGLIMVM